MSKLASRFCVFITLTMVLQATGFSDGPKSSSSNVQALAGVWAPLETCHQLLDEELVSQGKLGFEITIDQEFGDSHRKAAAKSKHLAKYYDNYAAFLKKKGHEPVPSGYITFDYGDEGEFVISKKGGSLYLWYGVVFVDSPRLFIGRGSKADSAETVVLEWTSEYSSSPADPDRDFATVIYERTPAVSRDTQ